MTLYHNINVRSGHDAEHLFYIVQLKKKKKENILLRSSCGLTSSSLKGRLTSGSLSLLK